MRDVIQKVIAAETEAKGAIEAARIERERILSDARKKADNIADQALRDTHIETERITASAEEAAEREKQESLARIAAGIESEVQLDRNRRKQTVEEIVRYVCRQG